MASQSPPPAVPPASSNSPPPLSSPPRSTPPEPSNAPPPQLNSPPPTTTLPPQSSPPTNVAPPPPALPPPPVVSPPPTTSSPPQPTPSPPPANTPPTSSSTPPPSIPPSSSPPPLPNQPASSPPPPVSNPPASSPPPPSNAPARSPPSPSTNTPLNSPPSPSPIPSSSPPAPPKTDPPSGPPPPTQSPENSPPPLHPPPSGLPPVNSPPPQSSKLPENSPPQPAAKPPRQSPPPPPPAPLSPESSPPPPALLTPPKSPPPFLTPPSRSPPASPPSSNSPQRSPPPPPTVLTSPPPPPSVVSSPTDNNNSSTNAPESSQSAGGGGIGTGGTIAIVSVLVFLLLSIFALVGWCVWKRKKKASGLGGGYIMPTSLGSSPKSDSTLLKVQISAPINGNGSGSGFKNSPRESGTLGNSRPWFTYEELVEATNGFSGQNLLGEGGFGSVYKGYLADGRVIAVKQLKIDGGQGEREFRSEVEIISRIHHRHLVSLVGYCISESRRLLVYDYVPNNTLYYHLQGEGRPVINWATRIRIAVGAARGIAYLHEDCHPRIIHRDIKSSNILLDNNFEAQVSDFGLAKLAMDTDTHITTRVMGTFGYMAPEYATSGKLTEKSDVFSYGVVLLELITGRKPVDTSRPLGEESLVEWARPLLSHAFETGEFERLADSRLEGNYVDSEMFRMIEAAAVCVRHSAAKRPKMGQVVRVFDSMATSDLTNGMKVGDSAIFNSTQQSAEIRLFRRMAFGSQNYSTDFFSQNSSSGEGRLENSR